MSDQELQTTTKEIKHEVSYIRIKNVVININLLTNVIYREQDDATVCSFVDGDCEIIDGNHLDFICEVLGDRVLSLPDRVKKEPDELRLIKANIGVLSQYVIIALRKAMEEECWDTPC